MGAQPPPRMNDGVWGLRAGWPRRPFETPLCFDKLNE